MAKRSTTEDHLAILRELRGAERSEAGVASLEAVLRAARLHGLVLKMAAELAEKWEAKALAPALQAAAESMAEPPENTKRDMGCEGKVAVLHALVTWEADMPAFYLAAARWTQFEATKTGPVDRAGECRGLAAIGIAQTRAGGAEAIMVLIDLLADKKSATRLRAAQALSMWRGPETLPLLRLKAHAGDDSADVVGEVLVALLRHDPRHQVEFVARFLEHEDPKIVESAALALGESRQVAALAPLAAACDHYARHPIHTSLLMAVALLRQDESLDWLLKRFHKAMLHGGIAILDALRIYRGDQRTVPRIAAAAKEKGEEVEAAYRELFE